MILIANMVTVIFIQSHERIDFVEFWKCFAYQEQVHPHLPAAHFYHFETKFSKLSLMKTDGFKKQFMRT